MKTWQEWAEDPSIDMWTTSGDLVGDSLEDLLDLCVETLYLASKPDCVLAESAHYFWPDGVPATGWKLVEHDFESYLPVVDVMVPVEEVLARCAPVSEGAP